MNDPLDVELHDKVLQEEIQLVTELIVVATLAPDPELDQEVIDEVLGVDPRLPSQRSAEWDA